jgi:hypothetical protein
MSDSLDDAAPTLGEMERLTVLAKFVLDAKACARRIEELTAMMIEANACEAAAKRAVVALNAREAEIEANAAEVEAQRTKAAAFWSQLQIEKEAVAVERKNLAERETSLKFRMLRYFGLDQPGPLQSLPSFAQIEADGATVVDAHFDPTPDREAIDTTTDDELLPIPSGLSLTREKPARRGTDRR